MTAAPAPPGARSRARGALLGLAVGDAAGWPSAYHRTVRLPGLRGLLWRFAQDLDAQRVLRFPLPFTLGRPEPLALCGTDDAEFAAVAALTLLETPGDLLAGWRRHVEDADADGGIWTGIAERASLLNLRAGLLPPATGNDNPAHHDDGAVARAVPAGVRHAGDPERAAAVATELARITHAADGVWAAAAMAASVAAAVGGAGVADAVEAGRREIPADSWLGRQVARALDLAAGARGAAFDLAATLSDEVANASYSFGTVAPETLASAYALALAAGGDPLVAIPAAATVAKQADSLPAMVGALCGGVRGEEALPATWRAKVIVLRGICLPRLAGTDLRELADRLLDAGDP